MTTDFIEYTILEARRRKLMERLEHKANDIYQIYAPEKDKVSTSHFPWVKRTVSDFRVGTDFVELTISHFVTEFASNGLSFLDFRDHKLRFPAAMVDLEGDDLLAAVNAMLEAEAARMAASKRRQKKASPIQSNHIATAAEQRAEG